MAKKKTEKTDVLDLAKQHKSLVAELIHKQPEILEKLYSETEDTRVKGNGPGKPNYAEARLKHVVYLSGANETLLNELIRLSKESAKGQGIAHKQTKSIWINTILEQWLSLDPDIEKLIK